MKALIAICMTTLLVACAARPTMSPTAAKIQIQPANSTLLSRCKVLGPVSASSGGFFPEDARQDASIYIREQAARMGADVIAQTNASFNQSNGVVSFQGTAMRCY